MSLNILNSSKKSINSVNNKSSRKAKILPQFSISSENKPLLDLLEIQRKSFFDFLQHGIPHELAKTAVFRESAKNSTCKQELELKFNPETYKFISPTFTPKEAILNGKTYACKVYVQATLMIRSPYDTQKANFFSAFQKEPVRIASPASYARQAPSCAQRGSTATNSLLSDTKEGFQRNPRLLSTKGKPSHASLYNKQGLVKGKTDQSLQGKTLQPPVVQHYDKNKKLNGSRLSNNTNTRWLESPFVYHNSLRTLNPLTHSAALVKHRTKLSQLRKASPFGVNSYARQALSLRCTHNKLDKPTLGITKRGGLLQHYVTSFLSPLGVNLKRATAVFDSAGVAKRYPFGARALLLHRSEMNARSLQNWKSEAPPASGYIAQRRRVKKQLEDVKALQVPTEQRNVGVGAIPQKLKGLHSFHLYEAAKLSFAIPSASCAEQMEDELAVGVLGGRGVRSWDFAELHIRVAKAYLRQCWVPLSKKLGVINGANRLIVGGAEQIGYPEKALTAVKRLVGFEETLRTSKKGYSFATPTELEAEGYTYKKESLLQLRKPLRGKQLLTPKDCFASEGKKASPEGLAKQVKGLRSRRFVSPCKAQGFKETYSCSARQDVLTSGRAALEEAEKLVSSCSTSEGKPTIDIQIFRPWIFLGELPLMTKRGHFILNGSPRVIVNQIARCPGIYFQEKRRGVGIEQEIRVSADLIPQRGPWLRVQSDWEGRFWARLKQEGRVKYSTLYEAFQEFEKEYNPPLICLLSNSYSTNSSLFSKSENVTFQERKIKEDRQKKALIRLFKNPSRYSLGKLGRSRVNEQIHSSFTRSSKAELHTNPSNKTNSIMGQRSDWSASPSCFARQGETNYVVNSLTNRKNVLEIVYGQYSVAERLLRKPFLLPTARSKASEESKNKSIDPSFHSALMKRRSATNSYPKEGVLCTKGKPLYAVKRPLRTALQSKRGVFTSSMLEAGGKSKLDKPFGLMGVRSKELRYFLDEELMAKDLDAIHTCLERLLEGQGFTDDIDNLKNRFIRTSGKLLQQQFELGLFRLNEVIMPLLGNLLPDYVPSRKGKDSTNDKENLRLLASSQLLTPKDCFASEGKKASPEGLAKQVRGSLHKPYGQRSVDRAQGWRPLRGTSKELVSSCSASEGKPIIDLSCESNKRKKPNVLRYTLYQFRKPYPFGVYEASRGKKGLAKQETKGAFSLYPKGVAKLNFVRGLPCGTKFQNWPTKKPEGENLISYASPNKMKGLATLKKEVSLIKNAPFRWLRTSKPINSAFREFFGSNPLSQYMDQTNPLAEITHKRRLSSMGPGGIKRETAGMEVRGIHPTHYGRVCPIETPEGKNAGLVNSPTVYGRVGNYGFLETPLYQVIENQVQTKRWSFFSAQHEEKEKSSLATCDTGLLQFNFLAHVPIPVQTANNPLTHFQQVERHRVGYRALSPIQTISIATALIPFLEHDDANRALMGSNMQRQAIPLLSPERPIVGTGFEPLVVIESGQALQATKLGCVSQADANSIIVHTRYSTEKPFVQGKQNVLQNSTLPWSKALVHRFGINDSSGTPVRTRRAFTSSMFEAGGASYLLQKIASRPKEKRQALSCFAAQRGSTDTNSYGLLFNYASPSTLRYITKGKPLLASLSKGGKQLGKASTRSIISVRSKGLAFCLTPKGYRCATQRVKTQSEGVSSWQVLRKQSINNVNKEHISSSHNAFILQPLKQDLQFYERSNQETCLSQRPLVQEGDWIQKGDFLADSSASHSGDLALGKNVTVAYMPWEGYNFEDAIVISDRLVSDDIYTSLHIERYEIKVSKNSQGKERITNRVPGTFNSLKHLDNFGIARISSWVQPGDILVGKVVELKRPLSPYERLAWELASRLSPKSPEREKWLNKVWLEDISLRLPSGICGRVINSQIISTEYASMSDKEQAIYPQEVHIYLAVKRKIQIGDKLAGRHGNKGIVSAILPKEDMPYLGDGSCIDMVLNPLGVPSRMNLGQIFECLLGLAGSQLGCNFRITPFDEIAGGEASRSLVFLKLYQCRLMYKQQWLFTPTFPGKNKLFDGRTGEPFENWVTVGQAYMLKLIHMVDHKIHARSTGPYSLFTRQPVRGRSRRGGQRLGEMEVWAVEGFGAAYTLQEFLTIKSDDLKARTALQKGFYKQNDVTFGKIHIAPGNPEAFKVLVSELQALCLHIQM